MLLDRDLSGHAGAEMVVEAEGPLLDQRHGLALTGGNGADIEIGVIGVGGVRVRIDLNAAGRRIHKSY
jgi:hypothetical protein